MAPPLPFVDEQFVMVISESVMLNGTSVNSKTLPFPEDRVMFEIDTVEQEIVVV